jgi:hypothetical protein
MMYRSRDRRAYRAQRCRNPSIATDILEDKVSGFTKVVFAFLLTVLALLEEFFLIAAFTSEGFLILISEARWAKVPYKITPRVGKDWASGYHGHQL